MEKIRKDYLEIELDEVGEEGLFAELDADQSIKRLRLKRKVSEDAWIVETLTLDQETATGQFEKLCTRSPKPEQSAQEFLEASVGIIQCYLEDKVICHFCDKPSTKKNKVVSGETHSICASCLKSFRQKLDNRDA
jgi:hypothetical protein